MATNTLAGVNLTRIAQLTLDTLVTMPIPFSAFTTDFSSDAVPTGNAITTRFPGSVTVQNFANSKATANSSTTARTIELDNYVGVSLGFTDTEMSFSDIKLMDMYIRPTLSGLFENAFADIMALVTASNFSQNTVITAANFTATNVANLSANLTSAKVPTAPRSIIVPPTYALTLKTDPAVQASYAYGSPEAIRTGNIPNVYGFNIFEFNGTIPNNSENLAGIALAPQALIMAARQPALPRNWYGEVTSVTDPRSGLTIQMRDYYDGTEQRTEWCFIYGTQLGVTGNLWRIRSA